MKYVLFISVIFIVYTSKTNVMARTKTETQQYETLYRNGKFEIRFYPLANMASVNMEGSFYKNRNSGFQTLAGYIFGGNKESKKIAMTSPVRMSDEAKGSKMSFIMPGAIPFENLPEPNNQQIILHQSNPVYRASVQFGGFANSRKIEEKKKELFEKLKELNYKHNNTVEYLGYNPPYQLINRRNEVQVELVDFKPEMIFKLEN